MHQVHHRPGYITVLSEATPRTCVTAAIPPAFVWLCKHLDPMFVSNIKFALVCVCVAAIGINMDVHKCTLDVCAQILNVANTT